MGNTLRSQETMPANDNKPAGCDFGQRVTDSDVLVVLDDYPSPNVSEPIFRVGEKLRVLSEEGCWWKVSSLMTDSENYIPNNHVAKVYHSWLFEGVDRQKSEELLYLPGNRVGSFMVRESLRQKGVYSLSVRYKSVIHYRIFRLPNNWYYVSPRLTFQCLEDLVDHYSDAADGLCCMLSAPCLALATKPISLTLQAPPVVMRRNFDWTSADRSQLENQRGQFHQDTRNGMMSYGLRDSIASYLSLANMNAEEQRSSRKKKAKSMYSLPSNNYSMVDEEHE